MTGRRALLDLVNLAAIWFAAVWAASNGIVFATAARRD
jgi:hypothetical protein